MSFLFFRNAIFSISLSFAQYHPIYKAILLVENVHGLLS